MTDSESRDNPQQSRRVGTRLVRLERRTPALSAQTPEERRRSVLVLDADPRARARAEEVLSSEGYRTASTGDPLLAARLARDDQPALLLVDVGMAVMEAVPRWERRKNDPAPAAAPPPILDGYAALRAFSVDARAASFPAVFLTKVDAQTARFGVVGYVAKPIVRETLIAGVDAVFRALERQPDEATPRGAGEVDVVPGSLPAPGFEALAKGLRTALVVDPDPSSRDLLRRLLSPHGFTVYEAEDGERGLEEALARRPWLIVTEVNLAGLDGFELCRRIRAHSITRRTPLIFISSWDDYGERFLGLKLGADDYLAKGTALRELLIRIQLVLKRYLDVGTRTRRGTGLEGKVELIGVPGLLQMCHLGRFSGQCTVRRESGLAAIRFSEGEIVGAECGKAKGPEAVYDLLSWTEGEFEFVPDEPTGAAPLESFDFLLLEGCRRLDDERRAETAESEAS